VRKTVTVLTAGTPRARGVDPEALSSEDERHAAAVAQAVTRYAGTIASRTGDAVTAVFGVPRVHEDDAFRAVSAALEIRDALARTPTDAGPWTGVGIGTGEVLAGADDHGAGSVVGEPMTAAAELEGAAAAGEILLDAETERLVRGRARSEPVQTRAGPAWRLEDLARERPAVGSLQAPLVGRRAEVAQLRQAFERASRARALHLLTILGAAGIGKSRLAQELASLAAGKATVLVGRCVPYGEGITFWSLREMLGQLKASDSATGSAADDETRELADGLAQAIGDATIAGDREEIFWATRALFEALARERPLVVFFEDVHWAEPTLLDLVEYLSERVRDAPILVVCIARPELLDERPGWDRKRPNATAIALERLPDRDCETLIANLARGLAPATRARVLETAAGNPLFIEQLVAMIAERPGDDEELPIPPTIAALLSARLDRLGPGVRAVVTRAAVAGKEFSGDLAVYLLPEDARGFVGRHLETLVSKDLIEPAPSPGSGERFRFRHILIQQAAYRAAPKRVRAELHERVAAWIDDPVRGRADEQSEIVGYHLEQAFRYRAELGRVGARELELARRAGEQLSAAGERAFRRGDMPATVNLLGRAAALPSANGEAGLAALPELGYALFEVGEVDEASAVLADAAARARAAGDRHVEWRVAITRARIEMYRDPGGTDLAARAGETERAIEVLGELGDEAGLARAWMVLSDLHWSEGRLGETSEAATRAAELARRTGSRREVGWALGQVALCAIHSPLPVDEGLSRLERLLAAEPENRTLDANLSGFVTVLEAMSGRFAEARRHIEQSRALARDLGLMWQAAVQDLLSGYVELLAGDPVAAERDMREAERVFREIGEGWFLSTVAVDLPRAVYEQGRYDEAFALLAAIDETPAPTDREWQIKRTGIPARLLARRGRTEEAETLAREGVALAADSEFVVLHADVLLDLAEVLELAGRDEEAAATAAEAVGLYERKGDVAAAAGARGGASARR
jgi:class 3 adenylate cyclase/tetratricopeptide (TPR) repeat protein